MSEPQNEEQQIIRIQQQEVQINWSRQNEKNFVCFLNNQSNSSHFGKVNVKAKIETEQKVKNYDPKKQKVEMQTLKMQIQSSAKKNKIFTTSLPINRGTKKSNDSKIHFLLEITDKKALLTIADDFCDFGMSIKGKHQISTSQAVQIQKRKMDKRRKNSYEEQPERHNDPDFKADQNQDND